MHFLEENLVFLDWPSYLNIYCNHLVLHLNYDEIFYSHPPVSSLIKEPHLACQLAVSDTTSDQYNQHCVCVC